MDSLGECGVGTAARFRSPTSRGGNGIFWYTFAVGSVTVIQLSSEHRCSPGTPQGDFVARELARVDRSVTPWVVVTHHRPVYHFCEENATVNEGFRSEREAVLLKYGVDLVMTGHSHNYARTCQLSNYTCACCAVHMLCCARPAVSPIVPVFFLSFLTIALTHSLSCALSGSSALLSLSLCVCAGAAAFLASLYCQPFLAGCSSSYGGSVGCFPLFFRCCFGVFRHRQL